MSAENRYQQWVAKSQDAVSQVSAKYASAPAAAHAMLERYARTHESFAKLNLMGDHYSKIKAQNDATAYNLSFKQNIIDLAKHDLSAAEAAVRMRHDYNKTMNPSLLSKLLDEPFWKPDGSVRFSGYVGAALGAWAGTKFFFRSQMHWGYKLAIGAAMTLVSGALVAGVTEWVSGKFKGKSEGEDKQTNNQLVQTNQRLVETSAVLDDEVKAKADIAVSTATNNKENSDIAVPNSEQIDHLTNRMGLQVPSEQTENEQDINLRLSDAARMAPKAAQTSMNRPS